MSSYSSDSCAPVETSKTTAYRSPRSVFTRSVLPPVYGADIQFSKAKSRSILPGLIVGADDDNEGCRNKYLNRYRHLINQLPGYLYPYGRFPRPSDYRFIHPGREGRQAEIIQTLPFNANNPPFPGNVYSKLKYTIRL